MVSDVEKIRVLDELIKKYPEKKFLKDIRKSYERKSDEGIGEIDDMKKNYNANIGKEFIEILKPGECVDIELTDDKNKPIINAHICKTKIKD